MCGIHAVCNEMSPCATNFNVVECFFSVSGFTEQPPLDGIVILETKDAMGAMDSDSRWSVEC